MSLTFRHIVIIVLALPLLLAYLSSINLIPANILFPNPTNMTSLASKNLASAAKYTKPVAVFVGGTSGIGQGMAEAFNRHTKGNADIVLVGRNRSAAEEIISKMKTVNANSR